MASHATKLLSSSSLSDACDQMYNILLSSRVNYGCEHGILQYPLGLISTYVAVMSIRYEYSVTAWGLKLMTSDFLASLCLCLIAVGAVESI